MSDDKDELRTSYTVGTLREAMSEPGQVMAVIRLNVEDEHDVSVTVIWRADAFTGGLPMPKTIRLAFVDAFREQARMLETGELQEYMRQDGKKAN